MRHPVTGYVGDQTPSYFQTFGLKLRPVNVQEEAGSLLPRLEIAQNVSAEHDCHAPLSLGHKKALAFCGTGNFVSLCLLKRLGPTPVASSAMTGQQRRRGARRRPLAE